MGLPPRQQLILDQIEQLLQAADPRLKSMFVTFARMASREAMPDTESIAGRAASGRSGSGRSGSGRLVLRTVMISVVVISLLGVFTFGIFSTSKECPGLPSDQTVATAAVRYAACNHGTDAWSKGGR